MIRRIIHSLVFCLVLGSALIPGAVVLGDTTPTPSPYDLIDAVNSYRAANGLYALTPDSSLMAAAQGHAVWIVDTGQGGHTGLGGSDETTRAMWAGYGGGKTIKCDEAWAATSSVQAAVYTAWSDWTHQQVMLNGWGNNYTDVGAGVAKNKEGNFVFILDVCLTEGKSPSAGLTPGTPGVIPTFDMSQLISAVSVATPAADGSVTHLVKYGQSLVMIALAYGVKINDIRSLNNLPADSTLIYEGQKLIIFASGSYPTAGTTTPTIQGTRTTRPTWTPRPTQPIMTPTPPGTPTSTPTPTPPSLMAVIAPNGLDTRTIGMIVIAICALGLVGVGISSIPSMNRKKMNDPLREMPEDLDKEE